MTMTTANILHTAIYASFFIVGILTSVAILLSAISAAKECVSYTRTTDGIVGKVAVLSFAGVIVFTVVSGILVGWDLALGIKP